MQKGLILVDIQNDYFPGGRMELAGIHAAAARAAELLHTFRTSRWPVFHIQHIAQGPGAAFFHKDTEGARINPAVRPAPGETVIQKHYPNAFRETALYQELLARKVEQVVICGAMSHMCIDATTRAAADLGFACVVIHDACATRDLEFAGRSLSAATVHGAFMAALGAAYARVLRLEDFQALG